MQMEKRNMIDLFFSIKFFPFLSPLTLFIVVAMMVYGWYAIPLKMLCNLLLFANTKRFSVDFDNFFDLILTRLLFFTSKFYSFLIRNSISTSLFFKEELELFYFGFLNAQKCITNQ